MDKKDFRILVADDDDIARDVIATLLSNEGYFVIPVANGLEAIDRLRVGEVDLVITDLNMPEMDGITLIKLLRGTPANKFTPIVMLTTESQAGKQEEGKKAGASGWIVKPFSPDTLLETVNKLAK